MIELIATKKNGKYFIKNKGTNYNSIKYFRLNPEAKQQKSFDDNWMVALNLPVTIESETGKSNTLKGYKLMPKITPTNSLPSELLIEDYQQRSDREKQLYDPIYEVIPASWKKQPFQIEVVDEDCSPVTPKYLFKSKFPENIEHHEVTLHKYPCFLPKEELFKKARQIIRENIPSHCKLTRDSDSTIEVDMIFPDFKSPEIKLYEFMTSKGKSDRVPMIKHNLKIIELCSPSGYSSSLSVPELAGKDYPDLERQIDEYLSSLVKVMNRHLTLCPECAGTGAIEDDSPTSIIPLKEEPKITTDDYVPF